MLPALRAYQLPWLAAAALAACLFASSPNFRFASGPQASPYAGDFLQEWIGGWIVRTGDRARLYDLPYAYKLQHDAALVGFQWNDDQYLPMVYPPFYYLLAAPLSLVSVYCAAWMWVALMLAALVASGWIFHRAFSRRRHDGPSDELRARLFPWTLPAALLFMPVLESLSSSQKGTLCLLLFTATLVLWQRGKNSSAGLVFGLLAFKPQLTLVIALAALAKRDWRFAAGGLAMGAALAGLSLIVGVDACADYVRFALGSSDYMQNTGYDLWKSHTVWGFGKLLAPHDARLAMNIGLLLAGIVGYLVVRLTGGICGRWDVMSPQFRVQFAGLVIATLLLSPHLFTYDLAIVLLPIALTYSAGVEGGSSSAWQRCELSLAAAIFVAPALSTALAQQCGLQLTVPLLLVYFATLAVRASRWQNAIINTRARASTVPAAAR